MTVRAPLTIRTALSALVLTWVGAVADPLPAAPPVPPEPSSAGTLSAPGVTTAAARIDRLIKDHLARYGVPVAPAIDDSGLVRRAYLDIAGRIPTADEASDFLDDTSPDKRTRLVDRLLDGPGYRNRMFLWFADLFRLRTKLAKRTSGEPFSHWLKQCVADDVPYDAMVHAMLTATGPAHAEGSGDTGYLLRDRGMPEDSMSNTARLFLGMRIECAQCHDHPFADWSQKQYYEMVAFTGGMDYEIDFGSVDHGPRLLELRAQVKQSLGKPGNKAFDRMLRPLGTGIQGTGTAAVRLPDDYRSEAGGASGDWVHARTLFGDEVGPEPEFPQPAPRKAKRPRKKRKTPPPLEVGSRDAFADWTVSPDHPTFTRVIANRMWKRVMGRGLIEPVDDLAADLDPIHPELLDELEALMRELGYDLRAFQRVLHHTDAWQRRSASTDLTWDDPAAVAAPPLHRMQAEQLWDSLLTLVLPDVDGALAPPRDAYATRVYESYEELASAPDAELLEETRFRSLKYSDTTAYKAEQARRKQDRRVDRNADKRARKPLERDLKRATRRHDTDAMDALQAELDTFTADDALRPVTG